MKTRILPGLLGILTITALGWAQPQISGPLSGTMGPGDFLVTGNCTINSGQTLTLQPGTRFLFTGHYSLKVNSGGTLHAVGTQQDSIVFTHQNSNPSCDWSGIRFLLWSSSTSILSYCRVEYAKYHVSPDISGGGVFIQTPGITVSHCTIANNTTGGTTGSGGGIFVNAASVMISDCIIADNVAYNGGGISLDYASGATVKNCLVISNTALGT